MEGWACCQTSGWSCKGIDEPAKGPIQMALTPPGKPLTVPSPKTLRGGGEIRKVGKKKAIHGAPAQGVIRVRTPICRKKKVVEKRVINDRHPSP